MKIRTLKCSWSSGVCEGCHFFFETPYLMSGPNVLSVETYASQQTWPFYLNRKQVHTQLQWMPLRVPLKQKVILYMV